MKKLIACISFISVLSIQCVNFTNNMVAIGRILKAGSIMTAPIAIPATYYGIKQKKEDEKKIDYAAAFTAGTLFGAMPIVNVILPICALNVCENSNDSWPPHISYRKRENWKRELNATAVGYLSGLSVYATVPRALAHLRTLKGVL